MSRGRSSEEPFKGVEAVEGEHEADRVDDVGEGVVAEVGGERVAATDLPEAVAATGGDPAEAVLSDLLGDAGSDARDYTDGYGCLG